MIESPAGLFSTDFKAWLENEKWWAVRCRIHAQIERNALEARRALEKDVAAARRAQRAAFKPQWDLT
jgi:hypothetical protein